MVKSKAKRIIAILFLVYFFYNGFSQSSSDTLQKYSYKLIMIHEGKTIGYATGFFVQNNKQLYLLSNYHVFTGTNTIQKVREVEHPFDTILIEYCILNNSRTAYYPLDVSKIKAKNEPQFYWEYPDIYAVPIKMPKKAEIYSIEKFIKKVPDNRDPDEIIAFGFPSETAILTGINFGVLDPIAVYHTFPVIIKNGDTIQIENSYRVTNEMKPGMSGSPVFLKYTGSDYIFGGALTSHGPNQTIIVKPTEVIASIQKTTRKKK